MVVLTLTRKPRSRAALIALTAFLKTPFWSTARSCSSSSPSRWTEEGQVLARLEDIELLLEQQGVRAQIDELLARDDAFDDLVDLLVDQGLTAGDRNDRRAALVDRLEALFDAQPAIQDRVRIVDLAAARTGQIAPEQRLQHEDQRIALVAGYMLLDDVSTDTNLLNQWNRHHITQSVSLFRQPRSAHGPDRSHGQETTWPRREALPAA